MAIDFQPTDEQLMMCRTAEQFAASALRPSMRQTEKSGAVSDALRATFAEIGLDRLLFPEALGGMAADDRTAVLVAERLAYGDPGAAVALQCWDAMAVALQELGSASQTERVMSLVGEGQGPTWCALALSEAGGESTLEGQGPVQTRAERGSGGYRLNGKKSFVAQAGGAVVTLVLAQVGEELGLFLVDGAAEGLRTTPLPPRTGLLAAPLYEVALDGVQVADSGRLDAAGDSALPLRRFVWRTALHNAARCVGVMDAAWQYARDYAVQRKAFGKPIGHFQAIAFMLADMATLTDAARWSVWHAAYALDTGGKAALRAAACAVANAYDSVNRVAEDAVQILGGAGYVQDHPVEKWMRDARALSLSWATFDRALTALCHEMERSAEEAPLEDVAALGVLQPVAT